MTATAQSRQGDGIVFATSGAGYTAMARSAVRTLRAAMPGCAVDLFTDQPVEDDAFDRIHRLEESWFRPKMEALLRSRFARTIHLDSDCLVLADISDVFDVLGRFDVVGVQMIRTNWKLGRISSGADVPPAFPQINSGVLGVAHSPRSDAMIRNWQARVRETGARFDQPLLRQILWEGDLRLHVLPSQYNMMSHRIVAGWDSSFLAPRVLHLGGLLKGYAGDPEAAFDVDRLIGRDMADHVRALQAADPSIGGDPDRAVAALSAGVRLHPPKRPGPGLARKAVALHRALRRLSPKT